VHTYGNEDTEQSSYTKFLTRSLIYQKANAFKNAIGNGVMMSLFNAFYAFTLYFGALFIANQVTVVFNSDGSIESVTPKE